MKERKRVAPPLPAPDAEEELVEFTVRWTKHEDAVLDEEGQPTGEIEIVTKAQLIVTYERNTGTSIEKRAYRATQEQTAVWLALKGTETAIDKGIALLPTP